VIFLNRVRLKCEETVLQIDFRTSREKLFKMRFNFRRKHTLLFVIGLISYEFLTGGGAVIGNSSTYSRKLHDENFVSVGNGVSTYQSDHIKPDTHFLVDQVEVNLRLEAKQSELWIPFVCSYLQFSGPYSLKLQASEKSQTLKSVKIEQITIQKGEDPPMVLERLNRSYQLKKKSHTVHNREKGVHQLQRFELNATIENLIDFHEDCKITIEGSVEKMDGSIHRIELIEEFEAESDIGINSHYELWAAC